MQFYMCSSILRCAVYYFNVTSPPEIYSLSLHDALPISSIDCARGPLARQPAVQVRLELDRGDHTERGGGHRRGDQAGGDAIQREDRRGALAVRDRWTLKVRSGGGK